MVGYYGEFIKQVVVKRKPLTKLTGKPTAGDVSVGATLLAGRHLEGAADGDLVAVTGELSAGSRRGDPRMDAEAMAELQAGSVYVPQPYTRYTWRGNILWYLHVDGEGGTQLEPQRGRSHSPSSVSTGGTGNRVLSLLEVHLRKAFAAFGVLGSVTRERVAILRQ
eukprot:jgi/Tetstr1/427273/TSEL_001726.t1